MPIIETLTARIVADTSQFNRGMSQVVTQLGGVSGQTAKAASGFGTLQAQIVTLNQGLQLSRQAFGALIGPIQNAVGAASDLNEALNASRVQFGAASRVVEEFATTSGNAFGIAASSALQTASSLGAIFSSANLGAQASAEMSVQMQKLAADIASVRNLRLEDALQKIQAGLVGETEPLRRVGVLLDEQAIKRRAVIDGIIEEGGELTQGQKVQARYAEILAQTAQIQGDFANTADQFANAQRRLTANAEDAAAAFGQAFLPAIGSVTNAMAGAFTNTDSFRQAGADLLPVVGTLATIILDATTGLVAFAKAGKLLIEAGLGPFVAVAIAATDETISLGDAMQAMRTGVNDNFDALQQEIEGLTDTRNAIVRAIDEAVALGTVSRDTAEGILEVAGASGEAVGSLGGLAGGAGDAKKELEALNKAIEDSIQVVQDRVDAEEEFDDIVAQVQRDATDATRTEVERRKAAFDDETEKILDNLREQGEVANKTQGEITQAVEDASRQRNDIWESELDDMTEATSDATSVIGEAFEDMIAGIAAGTQDLSFDGITDAFKSAIAATVKEKLNFDKLFEGNILDLVDTIGGIVSGNGGLGDIFGTVFKEILGDKAGLDEGLTDTVDNVITLVKTLGTEVASNIPAGGLIELLAGSSSIGADALGNAGASALGTSLLDAGILAEFLATGGEILGPLATSADLQAEIAAEMARAAEAAGETAQGAEAAGLGLAEAANILKEGGTFAEALQALNAANIAQAVGGAAGGFFGSKAGTSAATHVFGEEGEVQLGAAVGGAVGGVAGGATVGASAGAYLGSIVPIIGNIVGAALGAGVGAIAGAFGGGAAGSGFVGAGIGQLSRRGISGRIFGEIPELAGIAGAIPRGGFDLATNIEKFPELFGEAGNAATAFATIISQAVDSGESNAAEFADTLGTVIGHFGEAGLSGEQSINLLTTALDDLGVPLEETGPLLQAAFEDGTITAEQLQMALLGVGELMEGVPIQLAEGFEAVLGEDGGASQLGNFFRNLGQEGITSFGQLQEFLTAQFGPIAGQVFEQLKLQGLTAMTDLSTLSQEQLGFLAEGFQLAFGEDGGLDVFRAFIEEAGVSFDGLGEKITDTTDGAAEAFDAFKDAGLGDFGALGTGAAGSLAKIADAVASDIGGEATGVLKAFADAGIEDFADLRDASEGEIQAIIDAILAIPTEITTIHNVVTNGGRGTRFPHDQFPLLPGETPRERRERLAPQAADGGSVFGSGLAVIHRGEEVVTETRIRGLDQILDRLERIGGNGNGGLTESQVRILGREIGHELGRAMRTGRASGASV